MLLLACAGVASAQYTKLGSGPPGKLKVSAASATGSPSQEVEVPVNVAGAANMAALELVLTYDPAILEAKSAERGALVGSNALVENYINPSGRLAVTLVSQEGVSGDGPAIVAHFVVKGQAGQKSPLRLENVRAWDGKSHLDLLIATTDGELTVAGGWPWWWIAVAVGVLLLLLLLRKVARRSRAGPPPVSPPVARTPQEPPPLGLRCPKCGKPITRGSAFCNHCGQKLTAT